MKPTDTPSHLPQKPPEESNAAEIAARLRQLGICTADCAVILGSGLSGFVQHLAHRKKIPYHLVEGLPDTGVSGHPGELVSGTIGDRRILVWAGRFHAYAGYAPEIQTLPVRISHALGIGHLLVTNAAGGLHNRLATGDIMLIDDFIDFSSLPSRFFGTYTRSGPLNLPVSASGRPIDTQGSLQGACTQKTDPWRSLQGASNRKKSLHQRPPYTRFSGYKNNPHIARLACRHGILTDRGCYLFVPGPCYETPAETMAYRKLGADAVGMSTTAELREATRLGMKSAGISLISNAAASASSPPPCHSDVLKAARKHSNQLEQLLVLLITDAESPFYNNRSDSE